MMGRARVGGALSIPTLIAPFLAKHSHNLGLGKITVGP